ncbi:MAG: 50S ribosomal protein L11 methyltransferase [Alphaproteobacteria bacterium]|nr:50S ribosomal protein L11 methyltransferase [Alphaproteobacteria bacterium]
MPLWILTINASDIGTRTLDDIMTNLEEDFDAVSLYKNPDWVIEALMINKPLEDILEKIKKLDIKYNYKNLPEQNWVLESQKILAPFKVGRFTIQGTFTEELSLNKDIDDFVLTVDAGMAFGTGRHETTKGCLIVLQELYEKKIIPNCALDLGCGSGILAMAIAKLWKIHSVIAVDNDPMAIEVTQYNCQLNDLTDYIEVKESLGFSALNDFKKKEFDLIVANILADPLCDLAPEIYTFLSASGHVILSGILLSQADHVIKTMEKYNLNYINHKVLGDWVIIQLSKKT